MKSSYAARARRFLPHLEELETRLAPAVYQPTAAEQLFLEQLNDARANPAAYGASIGVNLSSVAPAPPLAFNSALIQAADLDAKDMNARNFFAHTNPDGLDPGQRMANAGFNWTSWGESIAAGYSNTATALQGLITDTGVADLGHRRHLLAIDSIFQAQAQVGVGVVLGGTGQYQNYYVVDTAADGSTQPFITGVVYNDANHNGKYDIGEGMPGVTITVAGVGSVQDFNTGGYSMRVDPGTYTVTASGGGMLMPATCTVTIGASNARLNFNPQPLPAPAQQGPSGTVNVFQPTFTWNSVPWAKSYNVAIYDTTANSALVLNPRGLTGTSWTPSASLVAGHTYTWYVRGFNGTTNVVSAGQKFSVSIAAPTLQNPGGTVTVAQPTFAWNAAPWAGSYTVQVNDLTTGQAKVLSSASLTGTTWTPGSALTNGHNYSWFVTAAATNGTTRQSAAKTFTVALPAQTAPAPAPAPAPSPTGTDPGSYGVAIPTAATNVVSVSNSTQLLAALRNPTPGTWILLQPGVYTGGMWAGNFSGTASAPIVIGAANPTQRTVIQGGITGLQLSNINYVVVRDLEFTGQTTDGLNIDDGGNYSSPSTHITLSNLNMHDIGSTGIQNALKLSGLQNFRVDGSTFRNWSTGGCGIDMVGCYDGCIQNSSFHLIDTPGAAGLQTKGGSTNITVRNNVFDHAGGRAVQAGGCTDPQYFRQTPATYEAKNITIEHNVIIGANSAVAFTGVNGAVVRYNTIYAPSSWVFRILEENTNPGMVPSENGVVSNNIIVFNSSQVTWPINIGANTAPQTFQFSGNWWYCQDNPAASQPSLPTAEVGGTYGKNPLFVNAAGGDFHLQAGSGATAVGAYAG